MKFFFLIMIGFITNIYATSFDEFDKCQQKLQSYFENPHNPKVKEFLELQSNITAHRLAWAYIILWQNTGEGLEGVIKDLVAKRDADPELKRIYQEFKANKRKGLFSDDYEKSKHSLIAASMKSMQLTLIKDYKVPKDSPFLLQTEDINLASLLDKVASNESNSNVLRKMTNLMDTVDNSYNMREISDIDALKTQWKKGARAGYKGRSTEKGVKGQRGKTGTHHRTLSDRIIKDIEKIKEKIKELKEEVMKGISSCEKDYKRINATCEKEITDLLDQNIMTFMQGNSGEIINLIGKKYESQNTDHIQKVLSQGGKVLENELFNAKTFCNDPAKFICESKASTGEKDARQLFDNIIDEATNQGTQAYREANYICASSGRICNPNTPNVCSDCEVPSDCLDYNDMTNRFACYNVRNQYTLDNVFTQDVKDELSKQTQNAKKDIINMLNSPPYNRLNRNDRDRMIKVINDTKIKIPTTSKYKRKCINDSRNGIYRCNFDSDCSGQSSYCAIPDVNYNMFATYKAEATGADETYTGSDRPCYIPEGMALTSSENMYGIILHELGHLISHDNFIGNIQGLGKVYTGQVRDAFYAEKKCFERDELSNSSTPRNQKIGESIADGIQAQVIGVKIKKLFPQTNPAQFNPKVIEFLSETFADNCDDLTQTRSGIKQMRQSKSTSKHPFGEDRINRILFANKYISETLGCNLSEAQLPQSQRKYATHLNQCMNNP